MELFVIAASIAIALIVRAVREGRREEPVRVEIPADRRRKWRR